MIVLFLFFALIAPFVVAPLEILFPYPHLVEEFAKAVLILAYMKSRGGKESLIYALMLGFLFALSENVLYMFKIPSSNSIGIILRFILTTPMHMVTAVIIGVSVLRDKRFVYIGLVLAMIIHYFFNIIVSPY